MHQGLFGLPCNQITNATMYAAIPRKYQGVYRLVVVGSFGERIAGIQNSITHQNLTGSANISKGVIPKTAATLETKIGISILK